MAARGLDVPNGTRRIFADGGATLDTLRQLHRKLSNLLARVAVEQMRVLIKADSTTSRKMPLWEERRPEIVLKNSY